MIVRLVRGQRNKEDRPGGRGSRGVPGKLHLKRGTADRLECRPLGFRREVVAAGRRALVQVEWRLAVPTVGDVSKVRFVLVPPLLLLSVRVAQV